MYISKILENLIRNDNMLKYFLLYYISNNTIFSNIKRRI